MRRVTVPAAGGVLSALGIAVGDRRTDVVESVMQPLADWRPGRLRGEAECELRYRGQAHELTVPVAPRASLAQRFHARHRERFGFDDPDGEIEVVSVRVSSVAAGPELELPRVPRAAPVRGPASVPLGRRDDVGRRGVDGAATAGRRLEDGAMIDPAGLQVLAAALRGVAEEMGAALVRSAHSANIKERRDCSTAVFDPGGRMIAQAEHLPVHLGAMPDAVAAVLARGAAPGRGVGDRTTRTRAARTCPTSRSSRSSTTSASSARGRTTRTSAGCSPPRCPPAPRSSSRRAS